MRIAIGLMVTTVLVFLIFLSLNYYFSTIQLKAYKNLIEDITQLRDLSINDSGALNSNCKKVMGYMFEAKQKDNYKLVEWCSNGYFVIKSVNLNKYIHSIHPQFPTTTFNINGASTNLANNNLIALRSNYIGKNYEVTITVEGGIE